MISKLTLFFGNETALVKEFLLAMTKRKYRKMFFLLMVTENWVLKHSLYVKNFKLVTSGRMLWAPWRKVAILPLVFQCTQVSAHSLRYAALLEKKDYEKSEGFFFGKELLLCYFCSRNCDYRHWYLLPKSQPFLSGGHQSKNLQK